MPEAVSQRSGAQSRKPPKSAAASIQPAIKPRIMRIPQAVEYSGASRSGLYRGREEGLLTFVKLGGKSVGITVESLDAWIDGFPKA